MSHWNIGLVWSDERRKVAGKSETLCRYLMAIRTWKRADEKLWGFGPNVTHQLDDNDFDPCYPDVVCCTFRIKSNSENRKFVVVVSEPLVTRCGYSTGERSAKTNNRLNLHHIS
jgi:hypothetical protein